MFLDQVCDIQIVQSPQQCDMQSWRMLVHNDIPNRPPLFRFDVLDLYHPYKISACEFWYLGPAADQTTAGSPLPTNQPHYNQDAALALLLAL